jgi:ATP-dependent protease ClpP protease subunit
MVCHGYVYSCGTFILQAADERVAMPNSTFLLHPFSLSIDNTDFNVESWLKMLSSINDTINNIMVDRGFQRSSISGREKEDVYLNAREALTYGLVDSISRK